MLEGLDPHPALHVAGLGVAIAASVDESGSRRVRRRKERYSRGDDRGGGGERENGFSHHVQSPLLMETTISGDLGRPPPAVCEEPHTWRAKRGDLEELKGRAATARPEG